jgi:hypothetical protein
MRSLLALAIVLLVVSCQPSPPALAAASSPPAPVNFVCSRVKLLDASATCTPEFTDAGDRHTHSAIVTVGKEHHACVLNDTVVGVVCGPLIVQPQQQAAAPAKPEPKK